MENLRGIWGEMSVKRKELEGLVMAVLEREGKEERK